MKDFEHTPSPDNKVIAAEQRTVKADRKIAQIIPHPGHTVFEFDLTTGNIEPAIIESITAEVIGTPKLKAGHIRIMGNTGTTVHKKVIQRPQCLYTSALNKKNALKKFVPMYDKLVKAGKITKSN